MIRTIGATALTLSLGVAASAQTSASKFGDVSSVYRGGDCLKTLQYDTLYGVVKVMLPSDTVAGDTLTGTVVIEPKGKNDKEKAKNGDVLEGCVIDLDGTKVNVSQGRFSWQIPAMIGAAGALVSLLDHGGHPVAIQSVPVLPQGSVVEPGSSGLTATTGSVSDTMNSYGFPQLGQPWKPLSVKGMFDGKTENTEIKIGGQTVTELAESNRQAVVLNTSTVTGPQEITVVEQGVESKGTFNNVFIHLTAPKSTLTDGEQMPLTVEVQGLQGLTQECFPVHVDVKNISPQTVSLGTKDLINLSISQDQVKSDGTYTFQSTVTGKQPGSFSISGTLDVPLCQPGMIFANLSWWDKFTDWVSDRDYDVGPSLADLIAKLKDLRDRKKYDKAHGNKYQKYLHDEIEKVKHAMRSHHGPGGFKAALNDPDD